jgi:hypothetical protein
MDTAARRAPGVAGPLCPIICPPPSRESRSGVASALTRYTILCHNNKTLFSIFVEPHCTQAMAPPRVEQIPDSRSCTTVQVPHSPFSNAV